MSIADEIRRIYAELSGEPRTITVPEWPESCRTIHVFPLTTGQTEVIQAEDTDFAKAIKIIEVRAKNAQGARLFNKEGIDTLRSHGVGPFGPQVTLRVAGEIMADLPVAADESRAAENAAKN